MEERDGTKCSQHYAFLPFVNWHESLYSITQEHYGVKELLQRLLFSARFAQTWSGSAFLPNGTFCQSILVEL